MAITPGQAQVASAAVDTGGKLLGMIGQRKREKRANQATENFMAIQQHNQFELMKEQAQFQRNLNQQGHELQMDMWEKTNYPAQIEMMKKAGLNPALMYGMSGGGGTTAGSQGGGSAAGGSAASGSAAPIQPMPMDIGNIVKVMADMALQLAQKDNIVADTEKKEADTKNILKDTELKDTTQQQIIANIKLIGEQTKSESVKRTGMMLENTYQELENYSKAARNEDEIKRVKYEAERAKRDSEKLIHEIEISKAEASVKSQTIQQQIKLHNMAIAESYIRIAATESGIELNEAKMKEIKIGITQRWSEMTVSENNSERMAKAIVDAAMTGAGINAASKTAGELLKELLMYKPKTIKGYGK